MPYLEHLCEFFVLQEWRSGLEFQYIGAYLHLPNLYLVVGNKLIQL